MHRDGYAGAGVKDITDAAGVPKGSFYSYFSSKEALSAEVLTFYWDPIETDLLPLLADEKVEPTDRIAHFFRALADEHESHDFVLGCMIGRMALEVGGSSDPARAELRAHPRSMGRRDRRLRHSSTGVRSDSRGPIGH